MKSTCIGAALFPHPPIMLPEIGQDELDKIKATVQAVSHASQLIIEQHPETIIIMSPHNYIFSDGAAIFTEPTLCGNLGKFGFPELSMSLNTDMTLANEIIYETNKTLPLHQLNQKDWGDRYGYSISIDQGTFVPMYYLQKAGFQGSIVLLSPCFYHYNMMTTLGDIVMKAAGKIGRRIAVIASGDLSHRLLPHSPNGYTPQGAVFDNTVMDSLKKQDITLLRSMPDSLIEEAGMCGLPSVYFLFGILCSFQSHMPVYSYEGPFGVGYGVALYLNENRAPQKPVAEKDIRIQLARRSIEYYLSHHAILSTPSSLPEELTEKSGVFVSLKKQGELRGCIGTYLPIQLTEAAEIIHNAVAAAVRDPRFYPVELNELKDITISVDVLGIPEAISSSAQLDPKKYGVIVMSHANTGLLLPNLEGIDTVEQQIAIAKQKAHIPAAVHPDLYRFTVTRYE
ncbi:MAG: AmmeMemoRadiSam system protein A [Megasphaera sp.]|uniref:AmmeMemoRadiSam system protein A n=1 Tax=Megasphaera sueciensis TaxID=349094 RepID=UPI003CFDE673|nr:AmmeMemoRadiSam system protein A [Megasphaera sp.]MCI1823474.1 AmmeMemoRadiSam system protein A [Megasphaera sp.]